MSIEENYVNRQESETADRAGRGSRKDTAARRRKICGPEGLWMPDLNNFRL